MNDDDIAMIDTNIYLRWGGGEAELLGKKEEKGTLFTQGNDDDHNDDNEI